jgi:putative tryptophan/tyrosine transport system substrate-binding protein
MRRRAFTALICSAAVRGSVGGAVALLSTRLLSAQTRDKAYRIGFLGNRVTPSMWQAFLDGLRERGWDQSRNLIIESRWAEGRVERYPELAGELVALNLDVLVASAPPGVRAAKQATRTIPIIMMAVSDPVEMGLITSLSRPGGNITGVASSAGAGLFSKLLDLAKEAIPSATRAGILFNNSNPMNYAAAYRSEIVAAAEALGLRLVWLPAVQREDFDTAFAEAGRHQVHVVIGVGDPLLFAARDLIHELAERSRIPTVWPTREYLAGQGLLSHGPSLERTFRQVTVYVDKVLRGADPATIPLEQPTGYELVVNLKAARALDLDIPPTLLARADEVIE